jgi:hypothetical protein
VDQDLSVVIFADEPALVDVALYWLTKRNNRLMPDRAEIDPLELPPAVWPNLLLTEPVPGSSAMRYRLVGSAHVERYTFDFTGKTTAEIMQGSYRDYMEGIYRTALDKKLPVYSESIFRWDDADYAHGHASTRRLMLPLSRGQPDVAAQVLSVQVWPTRLPSRPRSIPDLSRNADVRGSCILLDRDDFRILESQLET